MKRWLFLLTVIPLLSAACRGAELQVTGTPDVVTSPARVTRTVAATPTAWPTATLALPSPTPTPPPTTTPSPVPTATPPPTMTPSSTPTATPSLTVTPSPEPTSTPSSTPPPSPTPTLERAPELSAAQLGTAQNFELVGYHPIGSIGWHSGLALKDVCAYVGNYVHPTVSIIQISEPARPLQLDGLPISPGAAPVELRTISDLNLLVVADMGLSQLLTFDVSDCAQPAALGRLDLPGPPHEFYLWRNESRVLAYLAMFDHAPPDLVVIDLTEPSAPEEVARWSAVDEGVP
ncbi:MAG: hypothetical protein JSV36_06075, partial [Anaerolineae bacterium]